MKKIILFILCEILFVYSFSQTVEKIGQINTVIYKDGIAGGPGSPNEIYVNEKDEKLKIINKSSDYTYFSLDNLEGIEKEMYRESFQIVQQEFENIDINFSNTTIRIVKGNEQKAYIGQGGTVQSGISFILKKGSGYIVYYVDKTGKPGAVDTEGVIYTSEEAMGYLKAYDSEKYEESLARAEELGLKQKFLNNEVLVWGRTYYSTLDILTAYWKPETYLYGNGSQPIQYDMQGNGYGANIRPQGVNSNICINNPDGQRIVRILIQDKSTILTETEKKKNEFSSSWYVGFGGNIYYYVAGEDYTEVFRIRRTWGEPDFYAMAINGWTDDDYGDYVESVLPTLSAADLRLLRNTVFALYGYHFNSADLASYFDRQVWYTDEGRTTSDITLPEHRARLVEMIQALETQ